jgi:TonB-linked SusC/RagA family outer membrane protein
MRRIIAYFTCFLLVIVLSNNTIQAQVTQTLIRGNVTSAEEKGGLPGASVSELDKDNRIVSSTITDVKGNYTLRVSNTSNRISISFIGHKTVSEEIGNRTVINKTLEPEGVELETVEVKARARSNTGFMDIEDRDLTFAVQTISTKELEGVSATSIDEALQGRLSGVDITANSGDPGAGMSIRIRGTSSINKSSEPLIVIDGIPYDTDIADDFDFASADEDKYAQMLNLAPENIKEISVLKDAAATAVWGSKAANGVLMVTTKRGVKGTPRVSYSYKSTWSLQPDPIPMLNGDEYSMLINESWMNAYGTTLSADEFMYDPSLGDTYYNYSQNTDWVKAITRTGRTNDHNISVAGGGDKARYRIGIGYLDQVGTTIGTRLKRLNTTMALDYFVSDKISFSTDFNYTRGDNDKNYETADKPKVREMAYKKMPNQSIYAFNDDGELTPNYFSPESNLQGTFPNNYNPVAMANEAVNNVISDRIRPNFSLKYNIAKGLKYTVDLAFDINSEKNKKFLPQIATGQNWLTSQYVNLATETHTQTFIVQSFNRLYYSPDLGDNHKLNLMASLITYDKMNNGYKVIASNSASTNLQDPSVLARLTGSVSQGITSENSENRSLGGLFVGTYSLLDRYIFSGSIRRDGNSKFGSRYRWGTFPGLSARWRVSGEPFMKSITAINDFSIRASYGENGNASGSSYSGYNTYTTYGWTYLNQVGVYSNGMELSNLKWETTTQKDIGFNLEMFKSRINIDVDFYQKRTNNLYFEDISIPSTSGYSKIDMNVGSLDNQGWEVLVQTSVVRQKDFSIDFNFNISRNINIIRSISDLYPQESGSAIANGQYLSRIQIDNPIGSFYGYRYKGVYTDNDATVAKDASGNAIKDVNGNPIRMVFNYPSTSYLFQGGDAIYEDINHDGNINQLDIVYLGDANPLFSGGFGPMVRYKSLTLNAYFHFRYGNDIVNKARMEMEKMEGYDNQSRSVLRRWRHDGDKTDIPRALLTRGYNYLGSDRFVEDGSFLRLKTLTLKFDVPKKYIEKMKLNSLGFYITGTNLWTFTNYTGQDPEISMDNDDPFAIGYDKSRTPRSTEFMLGINIGF